MTPVCFGTVWVFSPVLKKNKKVNIKATKANVWLLRLAAKHQDEQHFSTCLTALLYDYAICNEQHSNMSVFCCIIQKESLKKPTTCTGTMLHSRSSHAEKQIRFCFFGDATGGCAVWMQRWDSWIHAWQTGGISKGKRTVSRWEHGSYRRKIGPNHVKIHLYGWIPTLIKQNC